MRKLMGCVIAAVGLMALPQLALAQRAAAARSTHEFGVDLGAAFGHFGSGCTGSCGSFEFGTPVDVRVGFVGQSMSFEPRFTLSYISQFGNHVMAFNPDLNVVKPMGSSTAHKGMYLTGGAGINFTSAKIAGTSTSASQFSLNGGVGTRTPFESSAWRLEGFLRYNFQNKGKGIPSSYNIGARIGMSFWR